MDSNTFSTLLQSLHRLTSRFHPRLKLENCLEKAIVNFRIKKEASISAKSMLEKWTLVPMKDGQVSLP
jgi:hypothetical protein